MEKIKFDFEATKERIYAPNSNVPIGAPVDRNGNIANDGNAYGIVLCKETENEKYWVKYNLVVMVAGYCDIIDAQAIWGGEYSAEAIAAMSDIVFCDNHMIPGGADPVLDNAKSTGGIGWTESGELEEIFTKDFVSELNQGIYGVQFENEDGTILVLGTDYIVNFDGVDYSCKGVEVGEMIGVGNVSLMPTGGDDTGEPFVVGIDQEFGMIITTTGGNHSITISAPSETVHKIDEKYLPEAGGGTMIVNFELNDGEYVADKTFNEILNAFPNVQGSYFHGEVIYHVQENDGDYAISFMSLNTSSTKLLVDQFIIDSDNSIERIEKSVSFNSETPS